MQVSLGVGEPRAFSRTCVLSASAWRVEKKGRTQGWLLAPQTRDFEQRLQMHTFLAHTTSGSVDQSGLNLQAMGFVDITCTGSSGF